MKQTMPDYSRRTFMQSLGAMSLTVMTGGCASSWRNIRGANDTVRVAVAGLRGKGAHHIEVFKTLPNVRIAAICDVDSEILQREKAKINAGGGQVSVYSDIRKMLDQKDIDAVVIASPNHWHALMGIWACQAGKDVYVEKPVSHSVWEGRQLVNAAAKTGRIVQAGTQKRSDPGLIEAFDYIRQGHLGKIIRARGFCYKRRKSIGNVSGPQKIPSTIDFNLWTGPAEMQPLMRENLHYDWHWVWNTGNGDIGNQGIHEVDLCRWVLNETALPQSVISYGGRFGYQDDGETANTQILHYDYPGAPVLFEVRGLPEKAGQEIMSHYRGIRIGVVIECEDGYFAGGDGGGWIYDNAGTKMKQFIGTGGVSEHAANFIDCIRSRKSSDLNAPIQEGHISSALCHLGNISYRMGTEQPFTDSKQKFSDSEQDDAFRRLSAHLKNNALELSSLTFRAGAVLKIDSHRERFKEESSYDIPYFANQMLRSSGRYPFVVPDLE